MAFRPVVAINYKVYPTAFGERGLEIAKAAVQIHETYGDRIRLILVTPLINSAKIATLYHDTFAQHADPVGMGAYTGYTPVEALALEGVAGVMLNHSEHKILYRDLSTLVSSARSSGLEVLVCADTPGEASGIAYLRPDMIALEPPELIGTGIPVSKARPEVIRGGVDTVSRIDPSILVLAGAGITGRDDAARAVELGAQGVLVASAVMKSRDPYRSIEELVLGVSRG
ncbi:MAG: triose-phosphate isomerase [Desulfurococcales archaeon]|nr:triose-phosphate isomerase [Desulfurococcales archaeon]MCE4605601.1 triose-phosphate isomerase [Desulfurococcales archaeon]